MFWFEVLLVSHQRDFFVLIPSASCVVSEGRVRLAWFELLLFPSRRRMLSF